MADSSPVKTTSFSAVGGSSNREPIEIGDPGRAVSDGEGRVSGSLGRLDDEYTFE